MSRIFRGEIPREPTCIGVDVQARLNTGEIVAARTKCLQGTAKLISLWAILYIIDHRECAARQR
jgi:hypothetical protein